MMKMENGPSICASPRRMRLRRCIVACAGTILLLVGANAAVQWWLNVNDFGSTVEKAGGKYYRTYSQPLIQRTLSAIIGDRSTQNKLRFSHGQVDDQWMRQHSEKLRSLPNLQLVLKGT